MDATALTRFLPAKLQSPAKQLYFRFLPAHKRRELIARRMRAQASWCSSLGSPLYALLLTDAARDVESAGICWEVLEGREPTPYGADDALPLRFMGAVHRLVLEGQAPALAPYYASVGGDPCRNGVRDAFRETVAANRLELRGLIDRPVQTNEVGRSAVLAPSFLLVSRLTALPLRLLEIGSSAGLNLRWDHYRYESPGLNWGPPASPVRFDDAYVEGRPPFEVPARVAERCGCDLAPLDPQSHHDQLTLMSYVWSDQVERAEALRGSFEIAKSVPAVVQRADAVEWATAKLETLRPGVATVLFHSFFIQYISAAQRTRLKEIIHMAGERATSAAPFAWLRMEWGAKEADVRLTTWPGHVDRVVATANNQGRNIHWLAR